MATDLETSASLEQKNKSYRDEIPRKRKKKCEWATLRITDTALYRLFRLPFGPTNFDFLSFRGTTEELACLIETLYSHYGITFNPNLKYESTTMSRWGKEFEMHARGIYYTTCSKQSSAEYNHEIWAPELSEDTDPSIESSEQQSRAKSFSTRSEDNERGQSNEFPWEADAWSSVFSTIRDDSCLRIDKHEYLTFWPDTDPVTRYLTGTSTWVNRTPDATFGLKIFTDRELAQPPRSLELHPGRLKRLLLHQKYGLICDPKILGTRLAFPFMVYEAKSWKGDCRQARRQATSAAAVYLDLLDELAKQPGQVGTTRPYQTKTSHNFQVFAVTSFGAYWHISVGYKRQRQPHEHAGEPEMSENVYIFHKVWSGHVTNQGSALQLITLIDQIHLWAVAEFRTFVIDHLRAWHQAYDEKYHLDWSSEYGAREDKKQKQKPDDSQPPKLPRWTATLPKSSQNTLQKWAIDDLEKNTEERRLLKNKDLAIDSDDARAMRCLVKGCKAEISSKSPLWDHMKKDHGFSDHWLAAIRRLSNETDTPTEMKVWHDLTTAATGSPANPLYSKNAYSKREVDSDDFSLRKNKSKKREERKERKRLRKLKKLKKRKERKKSRT